MCSNPYYRLVQNENGEWVEAINSNHRNPMDRRFFYPPFASVYHLPSEYGRAPFYPPQDGENGQEMAHQYWQAFYQWPTYRSQKTSDSQLGYGYGPTSEFTGVSGFPGGFGFSGARGKEARESVLEYHQLKEQLDRIELKIDAMFERSSQVEVKIDAIFEYAKRSCYVPLYSARNKDKGEQIETDSGV